MHDAHGCTASKDECVYVYQIKHKCLCYHESQQWFIIRVMPKIAKALIGRFKVNLIAFIFHKKPLRVFFSVA